MLEGLIIGFQTALSLKMLIVVIGGCLIGTFIGMLPGLGPMSIIAIMIPVAISMGDPAAALILLAGVYYGAIFGGSTSSILLNAPGVAGTVATSFDGFPMTQQGKAGKALTIAAIASFCGGTIGAILLMVFAPMLSSVALLFHSAEYFALMVNGCWPFSHRSICRQGASGQSSSHDGSWFNNGNRWRRRSVQFPPVHNGVNGLTIRFWLHHTCNGDVCSTRSLISCSASQTNFKF